MNERRIARLQEEIKARVAEILMREIADPKLGLVTVTRVELDREFTTCKVYWSVLGDDAARTRSAATLARARSFVQREVGNGLRTRTVPRLTFVFDESIAGAIRIQNLLRELNAERPAQEGAGPDVSEDPPAGDGPPPASPDTD
jgi:ribosome-binding factor A